VPGEFLGAEAVPDSWARSFLVIHRKKVGSFCVCQTLLIREIN